MPSVLQRLANWFRPAPAAEESWDVVSDRPRQSAPSGQAQVRRWDSASTTDFNAKQWANVTGASLNDDLVAKLRMLVDRCTYEISTNSTLSGMVATHATDIAGPGGPSWQVYPRRPTTLSDAVQKSFAEYVSESEDLLQEWFEGCDYNGELSGAEMLHLMIQQQWATGSGFQQIVNSRSDSKSPIGISLHVIHAERVLKSMRTKGDSGESVCLGIGRDEYGKRVSYYVTEAGSRGSFSYSKNDRLIPATQMLHHFRVEEPGQIAGVPWLAASLKDVGDIRQFDESTMKAAQLAASLAIVMEDKWESTPVVKNAGSSAIKVGLSQIMQAPKGKTPKQIDPKHPASNYIDFRNERWRDVARSVSMPLMIARLDSKDHSYASARMDRQLYWRSLEREQFAIEKRLAPVLMTVLQEAELRKLIKPRPVPIKIGGIFQAPPHADPSKEASARQTDLATLSRSLLDVWAEVGIRPAEGAEKLRRTIDTLNSVMPELGTNYIAHLLKDGGVSKFDMTPDELIESLMLHAA